MDLRQAIGDPDSAPQAQLRCSAKGCRRDAQWAVRWNNPTLHSPDRRKVWLACADHEPTLREFLSMRGFYRDTIPVADLGPSDG